MKFDNIKRKQYNESHAYSITDIEIKAEELRVLASKHNDNI